MNLSQTQSPFYRFYSLSSGFGFDRIDFLVKENFFVLAISKRLMDFDFSNDNLNTENYMKWLHRTIIQNELASLLIKSLLNYRSKTTPQPHTCLKTPTHQLEILLKQNQLIVHLIISIQMWKCNRSKFSEKNCVFKIFLFPTDKTFFYFVFTSYEYVDENQMNVKYF